MAAANEDADGASITSHPAEQSQTAQEYIASQLSLEADAREALPYQFDTCTKSLGPLRQSVYACLTCTPPPSASHPEQLFNPAGVCYSCSISCHGDHELVELFAKRDFECDCGTTRFASAETSCALRSNAVTGRKGEVSGEKARLGNKYNQNFSARFCSCGEEYDPEKEKGTMFQCLGLEGGCGEDWWHPECLMGLSRTRPESHEPPTTGDGRSREEGSAADEGEPPPGFPNEDDFDHLICYQCVDAHPWIKQYAGTPGFLTGLAVKDFEPQASGPLESNLDAPTTEMSDTKKRKAETYSDASQEYNKRARSNSKSSEPVPTSAASAISPPKHASLPPPSSQPLSLFARPDFREHLCRCPTCFPLLARNPPLLEEEDTYEPPTSESGSDSDAASLLDRGEAALSSLDRVRAIEGAAAYGLVRDGIKEFLRPFAQSGKVVGAEDVRAYFAALRGEAVAGGGSDAEVSGGGVGGDSRREQDGY